ncbi:MAG: two-component system sensor histidine kinase SenX3 [Verrucomicrobiales bacterium]|jgi:two-component system sensor histidine kinase SenX3
MWQFFTLVLIIVITILLFANQQREKAILRKLKRTLGTARDTRAEPTSVDAALDRLANLVHSDQSNEMPRRIAVSFDAMTTGAVIVDADGVELMRNARAMPYSHGRHGNALIESVIQARLQQALRGQATDEELRLHGAPEKVLLVVGSPLVESGELLGAVVLIDDISEQHHLDRVRRDFVANVSHELRTPVGAMSLLAETLQGETDSDIIETFLARIQNEATRLSGLIDDLLDLSRIEGGIETENESLRLGDLLEESAAAVRAAADHKKITLAVDVHEKSVIDGDRSQLISAFTNLLSNAIKYTDPGGSVSARLVSHGSEIAVVVEDTGIGVPQQDLHRVFERFYRAHRGRAASSGGTGLGLSIVRNVAVNHGGRVELTSQEGVGSTFSMILPITGRAVESESVVYGEPDE